MTDLTITYPKSDEVTLPKVVETVLSVYKSVWEEYSLWSDQHGASVLESLKAQLHSWDMENGNPDLSFRGPASDHLFAFTSFNSDGDTIEIGDVAVISLTLAAFQPYPPYESCTPISRSLMVGDDSDTLPFMPFSDDPTYDLNFDIEEYNYFHWQQAIDPDLEVVCYETARRLIDEHNLSPADVDSIDILPLPCLPLLHLNKKRDFPKWAELQVPPKSSERDHGPKYIMDYFLSTFCSNLNCTTGFCTTHLEMQSPRPIPAKVPYQRLGDSVVLPCGAQCFLQPSVSSTFIDASTMWSAHDVELLFVILDYVPDISPCDLAMIYRKPCREVHAHRALHQFPAGQTEKPRSSGNASRTYDESTKVFTPQLPCKHDGPCDAQSACACYLNKAHCHVHGAGKGAHVLNLERSAGRRNVPAFGPTLSVTQRFASPAKQKVCNIQDPSIFLSSACLDQHSNLCHNVGIQRGGFKKTEVRKSRSGLGLFILEGCGKGELIAEYVGELIYEPTLQSRDVASTHRRRSYVFVLNPTFSVDATYAGNETRYMNHNSQANCSTTVYLVNGEHRIGVYAACPISEGEELFIDYGPMFFKGEIAGSDIEQIDHPSVLPNYDHSSDSTYSGDS